ncbi:NAD(P)/FAD-dependent oxidoreductase [Sulfitobacter donghicola]|uniref:Oxidoreductase n=1 Tax=Sulfitobacter donghicola DSW-25 = KCTC 12864 = JCM 14565 TaxID=1300350 RepID=A0A073IUI8_9RHOB|nr:FAD-binding oxidoreductase [Sulfitobacter donghicola]KEJ89022.1 oxidoreductase [Sulfitobacter donghicola DSW-25 = KCTC 12864 = JCM 14565]KIN67417.1 Glycine/D-amino acid oxidase, deaminating [Sulfitobacter donghicola DSW-25 = KCTC 12864 = JCM 14565]
MTDRDAISLWDASAQEQDYRAPMSADITVDVAIVGGGYTGLSTGLHCAEKGLSAHVLEAEQIGFGGSGRNCGLVNAALWLPPQKVREKLGETYGPRFIKKFGSGPEYVFSLIEKHQIRCEVTRTGTIHAAHGPSGFTDLKERHKEWQRLGEPVDLLSRAEVSDMIGTDHFHGGLLDNRCGTINPMGYCRGLARAALGAGATISTGERATKLRRDGDLWKVETDQGVITAKAVVLGTNAYTDDLWPDLKRVFTMIHYFQLATKPLGPDAGHILPGKQGLWDTGQIMFNIRRDAYDRLIVGSMGKVVGSKDRGLSHRWAKKQIARIFPTLGPVEFEEAWHGQIAMTPDHLPRIHELETNLFTPIGYNGRGITTGTMFGETMAGLLTGMDRADLPLPMTDMSTVASAPIVSRIYQSAFTAKQILKAI